MTFTETLFGGLLTVVVIFFAVRKAGLSIYWGGVLSIALPFLAYLGISAKSWPGGDVIAIHLAVFIATAGVLGVFSGMRRKREKMHWAPRLIIAFFCTLVLLMAGLLTISMNGLPDWLAQRVLPDTGHKTLHTGPPGVTPHDRNQLYEPQQKRIEQQRSLGWQVRLDGLEHLRQGMATGLTVSVTDADGTPLNADSATLGLWRMADSRDDRRLELAAKAPGIFATRITLPDAGRWVAEIRVRRGEEAYLTQQPFIVTE